MDLDEALYMKFLDGNNSALEELIGLYKESLTLFIYRYINDITESENLMIDTFAQLVVSRKKFAKKSSLKTYLFSIGRNEALRYLKKNKQHVSLDDENEYLSETIIEEFDFLKEERKCQLYSAMEQLQPDYYEVLFLIYFEEMTYIEAGKVMKKNKKQITNLAYRAKKALKEKLENGGFIYNE